MSQLIKLIIGILIFPMRYILKIRPNVWIFGADKGLRYSQNSKYLFEYVLKNNKNIDCYWLTQSRIVYNELKNQGVPVLYNTSIKGIFYSLSAKVVIYSTWFNDIIYTFPHHDRFFVYLMHGMPAKKIYYDHIDITNKSFREKLNSWLFSTFVYRQKLENMNLIPATSPVFQRIISKATRNDSVYITGQPRTDAFQSFDNKAIRLKYGLQEEDYIISYMPTHRAYGKGLISPNIFINNKKAIDYFNQNNIKVIWKQHINMLQNYKESSASSCFVDLSLDPLVDAQELLYISDILITDYSSCYIDYMILNKPILFYFYDDYSTSDNSLYISEAELSEVGKVSYSEAQLLDSLISTYENRDLHENCKLKEYHTYCDSYSCKRVFDKICELLIRNMLKC